MTRSCDYAIATMRIYLAIMLLLSVSFSAKAAVVEAANLNEAIEKAPCDHFRKNANGTWSLKEVAMRADKNPSLESSIIADPQQVQALDTRCPKP